ncbi:hypothetical protein ACH5RR_010071 [Cinchona calisaya]|uniref:DUF4378 domain-containing protein n=1 Tax=Cinchona calisaya TaxID=153742 RepID=A0ABD3AHG0_9GENT
MGKNMYIRHVDDQELEDLVELQHVHPSYKWGFAHVIDYQHWHFNIKKMLLQKINMRKRIKGNRSSKAKQLVHDPGELEKLLNEEEKHFHSSKESSLKQKRSLKTRIKSLIAEENDKQRGSSLSPQSKLQRTNSIHHLESPDPGLGEVCTDWEHPIVFFPGNKDNGATKLCDPAKMNVTGKPYTGGRKTEQSKNKDASKDKFKEHANVREVFKGNRELFLEIVQDKDGSLRNFSHTLPGSNGKGRLAKSGSFPAGDLLHKRNLEPSTLKQKQSEIWSAPKGEKLPSGTLMPKVDKFKYSNHVRSKSLPLEYSTRGSKLGQLLNFILESSTKSDEGNNEVLIPSQESKQWVQFEIVKGRDDANSSSLSVLGEVSTRKDYSAIEKDSCRSCENTATSRVDEENSFSSHETEEYCFTKNTQSHRRNSSLNESLDKYTWLFENNFGKEVNLHPSRSLKLRNEYEIGSGGNAPINFRRIRSLSNVDIYSSLQNGIYADTNLENWPITTVGENGSCANDSCQDELKPAVFSATAEENVPPGDIEDSAHHIELLERYGCFNQREYIASECSAKMEDLEEKAQALTVGKSNSYMEQGSDCSVNYSSELQQPCPDHAFETYEEEVSSSIELQISEGVENICDDLDEKNPSIKCKKSYAVEPSSLSSRMPNLESIDHAKDAKLGGSYEDHDADSDLDYVKDILENSGLAKDAFHRTWHSSNQPLDPSIFDEMESYWHKESSGEDYCSCYHHQLLFDLVNEKLLQMYDRSFTYYPNALSSSCHIRPFPFGDHIVDEICTTVTALMSLNPEKKQSLECFIALDMGKDDGWMNLQLESECLGLELEDMIFDELLEQELVCFGFNF